uniref:Protein BANP n=1 Tax=Ursus americanus TaxID=9643 RepID=A0A452QNW0_URSAM
MVAGSPLGATQTCNKVRCAVPGRRQNTIVVKVPGQEDSHNEDGESGSEASDSISNCGQSGSQNIGNNVTLITLNSEEDYPNGTWLGDENNPEMRVRCAIIPSDMLHISTNCRTAEKMALTLLDYLFHREVQAVSNLSGQGKHGKKQLDPLTIYGIRCHLFYKFGITESDWYRIKQSIDSKCRTAWRRKQRGQSLAVKSFSRRTPSSSSYSASETVMTTPPPPVRCRSPAPGPALRPGQCPSRSRSTRLERRTGPSRPPPYRSGAAGGAGADHAGQRGESPRRCVSPGSLHADRRTRWIVASSQMARASRSGHLTPVSSGGYCVWGGPWTVGLGPYRWDGGAFT